MVWIALLYLAGKSVSVVPNLTLADCRRIVAIHRNVQSEGWTVGSQCIQVRRP